MIRWHYLLGGALLVLLFLLGGLFFPWYTMRHNASGDLRTGRFVAASGSMETSEVMYLEDETRNHSASSSPQIFREPRTTESMGKYDDMPHVKDTLSMTRAFIITGMVLSCLTAAVLCVYIFIEKHRKPLLMALIAVSILSLLASSASIILFSVRMPDDIDSDLDATIFPGLFSHMELANITLPYEVEDEQSKFYTTRTEVYDDLWNSTGYDGGLSGSSRGTYHRSYFDGQVVLNVESDLSWGPGSGWYMTLFASVLGLACAVLSILVDRNPSVPFARGKETFGPTEDDGDDVDETEVEGEKEEEEVFGEEGFIETVDGEGDGMFGDMTGR